MISKFLNLLLKLREAFRVDLGTKIGTILLAAGTTMLTTGFSIGARILSPSGTTTEITIGVTPSFIDTVLSSLLLVSGALILIVRFSKLYSTKDIALVYAPGFPKLPSKPPVSALPKRERPNVIPVSFDVIDSYDADLVVKSYDFIVQTIDRRIDHDQARKVYFAGLGSVPYLYLLGTIFRNGHSETISLEYRREKDKWTLLEAFGEERSLHPIPNNNRSIDEAVDEVKANQRHAIGLAIEFTFRISEKEIPSTLQGNVLHLGLSCGPQYDALPAYPIQSEIIKQLSHIIEQLSKKASRVHLFVSAQASVVFNLGRLYQDGAHASIVIHNYDPIKKSYSWAIAFSKDNISTVSS